MSVFKKSCTKTPTNLSTVKHLQNEAFRRKYLLPFERVELKETFKTRPGGYETEEEDPAVAEKTDTSKAAGVDVTASASDTELVSPEVDGHDPNSTDTSQVRPTDVGGSEAEIASNPISAGETSDNSPLAGTDHDAASDAGSEDSDDDVDINYDYSSTEEDTTKPYRYEVNYCAYHLKRVEELFGPDDRVGPAWTDFEASRAAFFRDDSPYFRSFVNLINQVRCGALSWVDDVKTIHPLHVAASNGLTSLVKQLLEGDKTSVTRLTDEGYTALDFAMEYYDGAQKDRDSRYDNSIDLFKILLDSGADVNAVSRRRGRAPFFILFYSNPSLEVVRLFLDHGADLLKTTKEWKSSILHVFCGVCDNADVLRELLDRGAKVDALDQGKETPLHALMQRWESVPAELVKILIEAGADVNAEDEHSQRRLVGHISCNITNDSRTTS